MAGQSGMNHVPGELAYLTESTKLTADDFSYIHWDKDSGGPELFQLIIHGESKFDCDKIKQQILENQEIVNNIIKIVKRKLHSDEEKAIIKCLKEILFENKNLNFNKILGEKQ